MPVDLVLYFVAQRYVVQGLTGAVWSKAKKRSRHATRLRTVQRRNTEYLQYAAQFGATDVLLNTPLLPGARAGSCTTWSSCG